MLKHKRHFCDSLWFLKLEKHPKYSISICSRRSVAAHGLLLFLIGATILSQWAPMWAQAENHPLSSPLCLEFVYHHGNPLQVWIMSWHQFIEIRDSSDISALFTHFSHTFIGSLCETQPQDIQVVNLSVSRPTFHLNYIFRNIGCFWCLNFLYCQTHRDK